MKKKVVVFISTRNHFLETTLFPGFELNFIPRERERDKKKKYSRGERGVIFLPDARSSSLSLFSFFFFPRLNIRITAWPCLSTPVRGEKRKETRQVHRAAARMGDTFFGVYCEDSGLISHLIYTKI